MVQSQPRVTNFTNLCAAVAFERASFTGVVAMFVLYVNERYGIAAAQASLQLGLFIGATYLAPVAGGWLADRILGPLRACILGTLLIALGGCGLMLDRLRTFYPALALIVVGQGLFKPNAQALVSGLYPQDDPRRAAAFRTYYVAINVGYMVGPVVAESLRRRAGWGPSFAVVVVGALLAMLALGRCRVGAGPGISPSQRQLAAPPILRPAAPLIPRPAAPPVPRPAAPLIPGPAALPIPRPARWSIGMLCTLAALFCTTNGQSSGALLFWVRDSIDRRVLGWEVPTGYFAALPSLLVLCLVPLWGWLGAKGLRWQTTAAKLTAGMLALALAYALLVVPGSLAGTRGAAVIWIVASMALACVGELLVMATGMDAVARLIPAGRAGLVYGLWCAAAASGNVLAGLFGSLWGVVSPAVFFALAAGWAMLGLAVVRRSGDKLDGAHPTPACEPVRARDQ